MSNELQDKMIENLERKFKTKVNIVRPWDDPNYDTTRPVPEYCSRILSRFGTNPYGEPIYRVVWGQSRAMEVVTGGWWPVEDVVEYRRIKVGTTDKYIVQKWLPAETYGSPELFFSAYSNNLDHGLWSDPCYPSRGRYEHVYTFRDFRPTVYEMNLIVMCLEQNKLYSKHERLYAEEQKRLKEEKEKENKISDIINGEMISHMGTPYFQQKLDEFERKKKLTADQIKNGYGLGQETFQQIRRK